MSIHTGIVVRRIIAGIMDFIITLALDLVFLLLIFRPSLGSLSTLWSLLGEPPLLVLFSLLIPTWLVYYTYFENSDGQTPGKKIMKIKVVNKNKSRCNIGQIFLRNLLRLIDFLPAFYILGFISIIFTKENMRVGDIIAKTIVVKA